MAYDSKKVEEKWQYNWIKDGVFVVDLQNNKLEKKYILAMFPYPSGSGLHIGHIRNYTVADVIARFYRLCGFNVFFPIGWDSFGLPAEQYAIQTGNHPAGFTQKNIVNFKRQLLSMGFSYDWSREIDTSDPDYYCLTQWIFCQMYKKGLVTYRKCPVFWCPQLGTVLAKEEIVNVGGRERVSERGNYPVAKVCIFQWVLEITNYARSLLEGLKELDWPENIKTLQTNWIGLQEGFIIFFLVEGTELEIPVFVQRVDVLLAAVALGISINSDILKFITTDEFLNEVENFRNIQIEEEKKSEKVEQVLGQFIGSFAVNPLNNERIPIFIVNFVDSDHQVMFSENSTRKKWFREAVLIAPFFSSDEEWDLNLSNSDSFFSLEERQKNKEIDFVFLSVYGLGKENLKKKSLFVIKDENVCYRFLPGVWSKEEASRLVVSLLKKFLKAECYHLRDWVFCRQRYWGEPIPVIHFSDRRELLNSETDLPLVLPFLQDFAPDGTHYSPLEKLEDWVLVKRKGDSDFGRRDTNVMPQWAGSCWYYLGFLLKKTSSRGYFSLSSSADLINRWLPVDVYIGGSEHANLHLLYARFWHKFLQGLGIVKSREPFQQLICQGIVLGTDGEKMSKSRNNTVNPDSLIAEYGADALRLYVVFLGPIEKTVKFDSQLVRGMKKWLNRVFVLFQKVKSFRKKSSVDCESELLFSYKQMVSRVVSFYQKNKFNLVVSSLMSFINACYLVSASDVPVPFLLTFCQLLSPIAPHLSEELWCFWKNDYVSKTTLDKSFFFTDFFSSHDNLVVVQINGKKKAVVKLKEGVDFNDIKQVLQSYPELKKFLENSKINKTVLVNGKVVNFIIV